jgi:hypothetical protein
MFNANANIEKFYITKFKWKSIRKRMLYSLIKIYWKFAKISWNLWSKLGWKYSKYKLKCLNKAKFEKKIWNIFHLKSKIFQLVE